MQAMLNATHLALTSLLSCKIEVGKSDYYHEAYDGTICLLFEGGIQLMRIYLRYLKYMICRYILVEYHVLNLFILKIT